MSKMSLFSTSLVSALPAAYLAYLMVRAFLERAEAMESMFLVLAGTTLAVCGVLLLMPFCILIFAKGPGGATKKKSKKKKKDKAGKKSAVADESLGASEELDAGLEEEFEDDDFGQGSAFDQAESDFEASDADFDTTGMETEFDGTDAFESEEDDTFADDEFEDADVDLENFDDFDFEDDDENK